MASGISFIKQESPMQGNAQGLRVVKEALSCFNSVWLKLSHQLKKETDFHIHLLSVMFL